MRCMTLIAGLALSAGAGVLAAPAAAAEAPPTSRLAEKGAGLPERERAFLIAWADALALLPLGALERLEMGSGRLVLIFDFDGEGHRDVDLAEVRTPTLCPSRGGFDLAGGRIRADQRDAQTIRVRREVELRYDLALGLTGVRAGDLSVYAFFKRRPLTISTFETELVLARDGRGRLLLEQDAAGKPLRRDGEVVPRAFQRWLRVECSGRAFESGVGPAADGRELARRAQE